MRIKVHLLAAAVLASSLAPVAPASATSTAALRSTSTAESKSTSTAVVPPVRPADTPHTPHTPATGDRTGCGALVSQTGITATTVALANVADLSGPAGPLSRDAMLGARAFVAYANHSGARICGRRLTLTSHDSRTDAEADRAAYAKACTSAFAVIGSASAFDAGGASTAEDCDLPDLRTTSNSTARDGCSTCFTTHPVDPSQVPTAVPDRLRKLHPRAVRRAGYVVFDQGDDGARADQERRVWISRGFWVRTTARIDFPTLSLAPYVRDLKSRDVRVVRLIGGAGQAAAFARAMDDQDYHPLLVLDSSGYSPTLAADGGATVLGARVFVDVAAFEEQSRNVEMRHFLTWLEKVSPGAVPTIDGLYAWSAAHLFLDQATALGGRLTRARLITRLADVRRWTDHGLHAPQEVGAGTVTGCYRFLRLAGDGWTAEGGRAFHCGPVRS